MSQNNSLKGVLQMDFDEQGLPTIKNMLERGKDDVTLTPDEGTAIDLIYTSIREKGGDTERIRLERRSDNYLSLVAGENHDFCRLKIGPRSKWFSVDVYCIKDSALLTPEISTRYRHVKFSLDSIDDISNYANWFYETSHSAYYD